MSEIWTKICGTTRAQDAIAAAELGADAIGVILFEKSPRAVSPGDLPSILADIGDSVRKVAVMVDPSVALVEETLASGVIDLLQFHGNETPEFCAGFNVPYMKAIRVKSVEQVRQEIDAHTHAKYFLLDKYVKDVPGGTGATFDWNLAAEIVRNNDASIVLAGGLHPDNVAEAIASVQPFGVDAVSGIEQKHGEKDLAKLRNFIAATRLTG